MAKQAARIETKAVEIASDFGAGLALRWFGQEVVDSLPRYVRGKKAGQPKGWIVWDKAVVGGWDNGAGVVLPNSILRIRLGAHRYLSNSSEDLWWYKCDNRSRPDGCGTFRFSDLGRRLRREHDVAHGQFCPECGMPEIETNGLPRADGLTYRCESCNHQWMPDEAA